MRIGTYYRTELLKNIGIDCSANQKVLDVGGYDGYWLSTQTAKEKHVLDIDVKKDFPDVTYTSSDEFIWEEGTFDLVTGFDVLEHVEDPAKLIKEMWRVCKVNGKIILTTPSDKIKIFPGFLTKWVSKKWGHIYKIGFSEENIIDLLVHKKSVRIEPYGCRWYLNLYIWLWFWWKLCPSYTKKMVAQFAKEDALNKHTQKGYLHIHITKL